jgi:hypothetical protein
VRFGQGGKASEVHEGERAFVSNLAVIHVAGPLSRVPHRSHRGTRLPRSCGASASGTRADWPCETAAGRRARKWLIQWAWRRTGPYDWCVAQARYSLAIPGDCRPTSSPAHHLHGISQRSLNPPGSRERPQPCPTELSPIAGWRAPAPVRGATLWQWMAKPPCANAHSWFEYNSGWAPPDDDTLAEWTADGVSRSPDENLRRPGC